MRTGNEIAAPPVYFSSAISVTGRLARVFLLYLCFLSVFGTLIKSPFTLYYLIYVGYPLLAVYTIFFGVYFFDRMLNKQTKFTVYEWSIMGLLVYVLLQAGFVTNLYFGQPVILGILAQKSWMAILWGIIFFYMLKTKFIDLSMVRDALLFEAWFNLPFYLLMLITLNPDKYAGTLFVYCNSVKGGCQFEFETFGFAFAAIYYFVKLMRTNNLKYGIFFALFFCYIFFVNQKRGTSLSLTGACGLYYLLYTNVQKKIYYAIIFIAAVGFGVLFLLFVRPDILGRIQEMYSNIILVLIGEETGEASADARLRESLIAIKYLTKNVGSVLIGNGRINTDWQSGPKAEFGHFYASDIGLLGVIFTFGIIGLLIGISQYLILLRTHLRIGELKNDTFYRAILFFMIFFIIRGIPTGGNFFDPGIAISAVFVAVHYFFYYMQTKPLNGFSIDMRTQPEQSHKNR